MLFYGSSVSCCIEFRYMKTSTVLALQIRLLYFLAVKEKSELSNKKKSRKNPAGNYIFKES